MTSDPPPPRGRVLRDALRLAVGTLTAFPVPPPERVDRRVAGAAMALAPPAMLPTAVVLGLVAWAGSRSPAPPLLVASLVVAALALSTRAMHLDGLADLVDGLSAGFDRERALAVMKRSDTGPSGIAAIVLVLLVQVAALSGLLVSPAGIGLALLAVLVSRHVLAWACRRGVPAATAGGLGATVAGTVSPAALAAATAAAAVLAVAVGLAVGDVLAAGLTLVVAVASAVVVVEHARRRLGGITGDVLGAAVEVSLACALAAAAATL